MSNNFKKSITSEDELLESTENAKKELEKMEKNQILEKKVNQLTNENKYLKGSLSFLLKRLKRYIDKNQNNDELESLYNDAKSFEDDSLEQKIELEAKRREQRFKEIQDPEKKNEFSRISMDSYHLTNQEEIQRSDISRKPKTEEDRSPLLEVEFIKDKSCITQISKKVNKPQKINFKTSFDNSKIKFLCGLKNTIGFGLSIDGNASKRTTDNVLNLSGIKNIKPSQMNIDSMASLVNNAQILRKTQSLDENQIQKNSEKQGDLEPFFNDDELLGEIQEELDDLHSPIISKKDTNKYGQQLFENFIVIGACPKEIEGVEEKEVKNQRLAGKVLLDFDCELKKFESDKEKEMYGVLPNFCFPFGLALKKIHPEKRHQILTKNYDENNELDKERFFVVAFNSVNTYNQNFGSELLEKINPHHMLYCVSLLIDDYVCKICKGEKHFMMVPKVYSFVTYYPFPNLFFKLLIEMTKEIKVRRLESSFIDDSIVIEKSCDKIVEIIKSEFKNVFETLSECSAPNNLKNTIKLDLAFKYNQQHIDYNLPDEESLTFQSHLWCSPLVFSNIPFEDFRFLLYALMLEKHIAFVSSNLTLLTSTVITFFHIMKPILWVDTIIISLNESMLEYIGAPSPILLGINASKKTFNTYVELRNRSDCLFYLLDENEVIYPETEIEEILEVFPVFQDIKHAMKKIYKQHFNKMTSYRFQNVILNKFANHTKKLILNPTKEQEDKAKEIFLIIQNRLKINLIDLLPHEAPILEGNNLDMDKIKTLVLTKVNNKRNENFLKEFMQTQNVMYFIQKYYGF